MVLFGSPRISRRHAAFIMITKTCPCNKQKFFSVVKNENFVRIILLFFLFLLGENFVRIILLFFLFLLGEAVLTCTHNLCFGAKIRKIGIPLHTPVLLYKSGVQGGIHHMFKCSNNFSFAFS